MKNVIINAAIVAIGLTFASCSNMTIGFEEDSPLYNGPLIDTRENKVVEPQASQKSKEVVAEKETVTAIKKENPPVKAEISTKQEEPINQEVTIKEENEENETTFSYDPSDGD